MRIHAWSCRHLLTTLFENNPDLCNDYFSRDTWHCPQCSGDPNAGMDLLEQALALIPKELQIMERDYFQTTKVLGTEDDITEALNLQRSPWCAELSDDLNAAMVDPMMVSCDHAAEARRKARETLKQRQQEAETSTEDTTRSATPDLEIDEGSAVSSTPPSTPNNGNHYDQEPPYAAKQLDLGLVFDFADLKQPQIFSERHSISSEDDCEGSLPNDPESLTAALRNLSLAPSEHSFGA